MSTGRRPGGPSSPGCAAPCPTASPTSCPSYHVVTKRTAGAFTRTDLEAYLRAHGVTQVVIVGVATSMGVESTARQAHELGFNVALPLDAMTDLDAELHAVTTTKLFPRLGETGTTAEVLALLEPRVP